MINRKEKQNPETDFEEATQNYLKPPPPSSYADPIPKTHDSKLSELSSTAGQKQMHLYLDNF